MSDQKNSPRENPHEPPKDLGREMDEVLMTDEVEHPITKAKGQPAGLWVLFVTEMWERFSYYGMKAILVLYLTAKLWSEGSVVDNPGFGWTDQSAGILLGWYSGLVYLTPIIGGWLADRFLGTHRSMVLGGWIIAAGHFCLAISELGAQQGIEYVALGTAPAQILLFMLGLFLIIVGTGFFKPCCSVMVGQLYADDDPRRDSGFTIFYMGINIGAFLSSIVTGYLAHKYGWHYGFGAAGVGMIFGLFVYQFLRPRYLEGVGLPPGATDRAVETMPQAGGDDCRSVPPATETVRPLNRIDRDRLTVIVVLVLFTIIFWLGFEQAAGTLTVFAERHTARAAESLSSIPGAPWMLDKFGLDEIPAPWFLSINPAVIVLFAPLFAWLWIWLDRRGLQPSTPVKFGLGLILLSLGYVIMVFGALEAKQSGLAAWYWLFTLYVLHTWGELCVSPVGLSMVTQLSPRRYVSLMMGVFFLSNFFANLGAGYLMAFSGQIADGDYVMGGLPDFFLFLAILPAIAGAAVLVLSPKLKRMMHGSG